MIPTLILSLMPNARAQGFTVTTYNAQFRPWSTELGRKDAGENEDVYRMSDKDRADEMVDALVALERVPEVIAFQEIFEFEAYETLHDRLDAEGYELISERDVHDVLEYGHGLLLASKWDAEPLGSLPNQECLTDTGGGQPCYVAFHEFSGVNEAEVAETFTAKGIAYARLQNPVTRRPLHTFFTHLHAGTPSDGSECGWPTTPHCARREQMNHVIEFIERWAPLGVEGDVVVMGDFNIQGGCDGDGDMSCISATTPYAIEWTDTIRGLLGPIHGLQDARLRQSPVDPSATIDGNQNTASGANSKSRLDYVLWRSEDLCPMQAVSQRGFEAVGWDGLTRDLSDHYALTVPFGADAVQCSPDRAAPTEDGASTGVMGGDGDYAWHLVKPGTWTFSARQKNDRLDITVYRESDLSEPLERFGTVTVDGERLEVFDSTEPLYVRVSGGSAGEYELRARLQDGRDFDSAVVLSAGEVASSDHAVGHFWLEQLGLTNGRPQSLSFVGACTSGPTSVSVFDADREQILTPLALGGVLQLPSETTPVSPETQDLYLVVACAAGQVGGARYDTSRRTVELVEFDVNDESDLWDIGFEEISLDFYVEGDSDLVPGVVAVDVDEATAFGLGAVVHFERSFEVRLTEHDPVNDDEYSDVIERSCDLGSACAPDGVPIGGTRAGRFEFGGTGVGAPYLLKFDERY